MRQRVRIELPAGCEQLAYTPRAQAADGLEEVDLHVQDAGPMVCREHGKRTRVLTQVAVVEGDDDWTLRQRRGVRPVVVGTRERHRVKAAFGQPAHLRGEVTWTDIQLRIGRTRRRV